MPLAVMILTGTNRPKTSSCPGKRRGPGGRGRPAGAEIPSAPPTRSTRPREREPSSLLFATALYRLVRWLSPAFPISAFGYSHGLETAVKTGLVCDGTSLQSWVAGILAHGSGRIDADILCDAHPAAAGGARS